MNFEPLNSGYFIKLIKIYAVNNYSIWKITPIEKRSHAVVYLYFLSVRLAISGATKPGVPTK